MGKAHISIGSNLGNSCSLIEQAVAGIVLLAEGEEVRRSRWIESEPWGFESAHSFLNLGVEINTPFGPRELLERLLEIEHSISSAPHRDAFGRYADRLIGIDLIYYDNEVIDDQQTDTPLILPHPRMHLRGFVLEPIAELDPQWRHPLTGQTAGEMLDSLIQQNGNN